MIMVGGVPGSTDGSLPMLPIFPNAESMEIVAEVETVDYLKIWTGPCRPKAFPEIPAGSLFIVFRLPQHTHLASYAPSQIPPC